MCDGVVSIGSVTMIPPPDAAALEGLACPTLMFDPRGVKLSCRDPEPARMLPVPTRCCCWLYCH